ncbi:MAG TPA: MauE/DoxX family redox-associated membrane protein [Pyrinomonadaceae bacterium]
MGSDGATNSEAIIINSGVGDHPVSASPSLRVPDSPSLRITDSPTRPVTDSPSRPVTGSRLLLWLARISRFFLAALFLFTAGAKLFVVKSFVENVGQLLSSSGINYERWSWPVTIGVIGAEIVAALLLLLPRTVRLGAVLGGVLLVGFAGYALFYVYVLHGEALECGCFGGIIASQLGVTTALRNLALLVPVVLVLVGYRRERRT